MSSRLFFVNLCLVFADCHYHDSFFFFNDTATTEIYTLSLHDALPISRSRLQCRAYTGSRPHRRERARRSEEHTSELQSPCNLVCRLLLEKKKKQERRERQLSRDLDRSKSEARGEQSVQLALFLF